VLLPPLVLPPGVGGVAPLPPRSLGVHPAGLAASLALSDHPVINLRGMKECMSTFSTPCWACRTTLLVEENLSRGVGVHIDIRYKGRWCLRVTPHVSGSSGGFCGGEDSIDLKTQIMLTRDLAN